MSVLYYHNLFAIIFFLSYTGFIFWYGFNRIKTDIRRAIVSIGVSIFIVTSSVISIGLMHFGYGIFELFFITSIIFWNVMYHDIE
jgi:hypothetical protein